MHKPPITYKSCKSAGSSRICLIDETRGFLVICMVFYHAFYSMTFIFNIPFAKNLLCFFMPAQSIFAGSFIFISGCVSLLSRSNLKRGAKLFAIAVAITIVTRVFIPSQPIIFGILHMLSICMILFGIFKPLLSKISPLIGMLTCFILFLFTSGIDKGFFGFGRIKLYIPLSAYNLNWLFPIGITDKNFYSSDYFPLFPWMFIFFFGTFFASAFKGKKLPQFMYQSHVKMLSFCGRHALIIYIIHQPIIFLIINLYSQLNAM